MTHFKVKQNNHLHNWNCKYKVSENFNILSKQLIKYIIKSINQSINSVKNIFKTFL
jgi:hypothetical protein